MLTEPSYYGQIITMTYPLIGNYGINLEDGESSIPKVRGFIVREKCNYPSNFISSYFLNTPKNETVPVRYYYLWDSLIFIVVFLPYQA